MLRSLQLSQCHAEEVRIPNPTVIDEGGTANGTQ
jgi:hypothetical protein